MKKRMISIALCLLVLFTLSLTVFAEPAIWKDIPRVSSKQSVYDYGNLFSREEQEYLEEKAQELAKAYGYDIIILTEQYTAGMTGITFAREFYEANGFGQGDDSSGVIFMIDMGNRTIDLATFGKTIRIVTDHNVDFILDRAIVPMQTMKFASSAEAFLDGTAEVFAGWPAYVKGQVKKIILIATMIPFVVAVVLLVMHKKALATERSTAYYIKGHPQNTLHTTTHRVNHFTTRTKRSQSSNNGGGGGSSGGSRPSYSGRSSSSRTSSGSRSGGGSRSF